MPLPIKPTIAIILPCYNEALTIKKVIKDFQDNLPDTSVYVYDNQSTDDSAQIAMNSGAQVRYEMQQGKGHVVRRAFRDIDADYYVMVDSDDTYDATFAQAMVRMAMSGPYDLINAVRGETEDAAYRAGHRFGNQLLTGAVQLIFGNRVQDMLSGYKVFSRRFVKTFPALSAGFDIETEITIHALELFMPVGHMTCPYRSRPEGSESKLRTYRDGWNILMLIFKLLRHERPIVFFGALAGMLAFFSAAIAWPVVANYLMTGLVPRLPTAVLSMGIMLLASLSLTTGIILDTVTRGRREFRLLTYLQYPAPPYANETLQKSTGERNE